jgi:hypothetical protein
MLRLGGTNETPHALQEAASGSFAVVQRKHVTRSVSPGFR